ncbi:MAG: hypothetical protein HON90_15165 [Halobacteriovoraceae bacterium]|jgi:ADP-heptose:LPS heptosyltransferase|nr:hypothetical protein [Halobacteriovoraceae bacterium]
MNIAIKLPNDVRERVLTFPFLHVLVKKIKEKMDEDQILNLHLISLKDGIDVLNLLPFHAYYHELEAEDLKTIFTMHRACANFKIYHLDYFISTTDSFVDASIGKNLGAEKKIGYALGKNGWFLNTKIPKLNGRHISEQVFELLKGVFEEIPNLSSVYSRNMPAVYADWNENPYMLINLDLTKDGEVNPEWKDFVDLFTNKSFVFMCESIPEFEQEEILNGFIKSLPAKNNYKIFVYKSNIEFGKLISYAMGFVTNDSPLLNIASYCGSQVFLLNKNENLQVCGPAYSLGEVRNFSVKDPLYSQGGDFNYAKIFDDLHDFIEKKTKGTEDA